MAASPPNRHIWPPHPRRRSPPQPHVCGAAASSRCRPRPCTGWPRTQPPMRPSPGFSRPKDGPAFNPLIAHVLDIEAAREHAMFGGDAERLAQAFWPGPLTLVLPVVPACRVSLLARAGLDTLAVRAPAHPVARALDRGGGRSTRGPFGQPVGPSQPDDRRPRPRRPRRQDRLDSRRRSVAPWARIDDRRLPGRADAAAPRRDPARSDRGGAGTSSRLGRRRRQAPNAPGQLDSHYAPRARVRLDATMRQADEAVLDFAGALAGERDARPAGPFAVGRSRRGGVESVRPSAGSGCVGARTIAVGPDSSSRVGRGDQRQTSAGGGSEERVTAPLEKRRRACG